MFYSQKQCEIMFTAILLPYKYSRELRNNLYLTSKKLKCLLFWTFNVPTKKTLGKVGETIPS